MPMIQVQIAATLGRGGVGALRWVLVDPDELARQVPARPRAERAEAPLPVPPSVGAPVRRAGLGVRVAVAAVLLVALAGAWGVSAVLVEARAGGAAPALRR